MLPELLEYGFMQRAFGVGLVTAVVGPLIGVFLVPRRLSLIADTLAHVALGGVALGLFLGISPVVGALVVTVVGAVSIERLRSRGTLHGDASLAVFLSGGFAVAVVLISLAQGFNADLFAILFGSILTVSPADVWIICALGVVVTATVGLFYRQLLAITLDEDLARTGGVPVAALNLVLTLLTALTTVVTMRMVGVLLVSAMIVIPTLTGFTLGQSFRRATALAIAAAVLAMLGGLVVSYYLRLAAGGAVVLSALVIFAGASVAARTTLLRRRFGHAGLLGASLLLPLGAAAAVSAHPHVFIEHSVRPLVGAHGLEGIEFAWVFDEMFSDMILFTFDADKNKAFSPAETKVLETKHFGNLKDYHYFVDLKLNDKSVPVAGIRDFQARVEKDRVIYVFTVPVKSAEGTIDIAVDDPTYYTAFMLHPQAPFRVQPSPHYQVECSVPKTTGFDPQMVRCVLKRRGK